MTRPLSEVLQVLESGQDVELPMDPAYYQRLHDRIMAAVDRGDSAPPAWYEKPGNIIPAPSWRAIAEASAGLADSN